MRREYHVRLRAMNFSVEGYGPSKAASKLSSWVECVPGTIIEVEGLQGGWLRYQVGRRPRMIVALGRVRRAS